LSEDFQKTAAAMAAATAPGAQGPKPGPDTTSGDYKLMKPLWDKVTAFAGGVDAMRSCDQYLPRFELESDEDYKTRRATTPFTNIYEDISGSLASKPFSREVQFEDPDDVDERFKDLYEDIDGQGNNLHVFSEHLFQGGIDNAVDWILVDYTKLPPLPEGRTARSQSEEAQLGARPYWVHVSGPRVLAAYSDMVRGKEVLVHVRISEPTLVRDGYGESVKQRVRIFERLAFKDGNGQTDYTPATWRVEEKTKPEKTGAEAWEQMEDGPVPIGIIPMVPFRTGRRTGSGWAVKPPLGKLVDMQLDAFLQESNIRSIELLSAFPMLTGSGVAPPPAPDPALVATGAKMGPRLYVGPRAVLYAPPQPGGGPPGEWKFIEPTGENIKVLSAELDKTWANMREIGMQPLAEANITVITSANVSVKAKSALQAWALRLKDALEQAFVITSLWMGEKDPDKAPGVDVYKDFGVDLQSGKELDVLNTAAQNGKLSGETLRFEMKRRNVLSDNFNEEEEVLRIANEAAAAAEPVEGEEDMDPTTGKPLEEDDPEADPIDPGSFKKEGDIDDATLRKLFGNEVVDNAI
jgi:hypothetical protein